MSGGTFNHEDYIIGQLADYLRDVIEEAENENRYSDETLAVFLQAHKHLRYAKTYMHRIDWLCAGDDAEDTFHKRLKEDLEEIQ
jgi:hypothetical protein